MLTARRDAGAGLNLITLTPPPEMAHAYRAPGQYIQVVSESSGYFVLAGEVGAPSWQLLVRNSGGAADALTKAIEGTSFEVNGPHGKGFPLERARGRALVLAVVGSALAVARPILRERIAQKETNATTVYIGVRSPRDVPLAGEVAGWMHAGAKLVLCLSQMDQDDRALLSEATRASGWVQNVLQADFEDGRLVANALVFAAGPKDMLAHVREMPEKAEKTGRLMDETRVGAELDVGSDPSLPLLEVITNV